MTISLTPIPNYPRAISLIGNELIPAVQAGVPVTLTPQQIAALGGGGGGGSFTPVFVTIGTTSSITQPGYYAVTAAGITLTIGSVFPLGGIVNITDFTGQTNPNITINVVIQGNTSILINVQYTSITLVPAPTLSEWAIV